jgi:hypothetical protein
MNIDEFKNKILHALGELEMSPTTWPKVSHPKEAGYYWVQAESYSRICYMYFSNAGNPMVKFYDIKRAEHLSTAMQELYTLYGPIKFDPDQNANQSRTIKTLLGDLDVARGARDAAIAVGDDLMSDSEQTMADHSHGLRFVDDEGRCLACAREVLIRQLDEARESIDRWRTRSEMHLTQCDGFIEQRDDAHSAIVAAMRALGYQDAEIPNDANTRVVSLAANTKQDADRFRRERDEALAHAYDVESGEVYLTLKAELAALRERDAETVRVLEPIVELLNSVWFRNAAEMNKVINEIADKARALLARMEGKDV